MSKSLCTKSMLPYSIFRSCGVGGMGRASSFDARGSGFEPPKIALLYPEALEAPPGARRTAESMNLVKQAG